LLGLLRRGNPQERASARGGSADADVEGRIRSEGRRDHYDRTGSRSWVSRCAGRVPSDRGRARHPFAQLPAGCHRGV